MPTEANDYIEMQSSAETRRAYRRDLQKWFDFIGGKTIDVDRVTAFKRHLELTLSPNSAARTWSTVRGYFKYLGQRTGDMMPTPFEYVKAPKRPSGVTPKVPTDEDVNGVVSGAAESPQRALIVALLLNGLRAGEVCALRREDLEKHDGVGLVLRVNGKGQKQRLVPVTVETEIAIGRYVTTCSRAQGHSDWLVSQYDGNQLTVRQVEHAVYKSAEYAGVEGMYPHALRHHYATRLVKAGASPLHVQQLLGHSNVSTTMVYVTLDLRDLAKAAAMDPRNQPVTPAVLEAVS